MKKSEMVRLMVEWGKQVTFLDSQSAEAQAEMILDFLLEQGMDPPYAGGDVTYGNEWDKE